MSVTSVLLCSSLSLSSTRLSNPSLYGQRAKRTLSCLELVTRSNSTAHLLGHDGFDESASRVYCIIIPFGFQFFEAICQASAEIKRPHNPEHDTDNLKP